MTGWARASELDRILNCTGSLIIPPQRLVSEGAKRSAAWGTYVHFWKETGQLLDTSEFHDSFKKTFDKKWELIGTPGFRNELWPAPGLHEVGYAYDCEDGSVHREVGAGLEEWKSSFGLSYITGTLDYESEIDGLVWVDDLKTGALFNTQPDRLLQLYFYAMCATLHRNGGSHPGDVIVSVTHWPKYPLSSLPNRVFSYIPERRMRKFQKLVLDTFREIRYNYHQFQIGDHCTWCPALYDCPEHR